MTDVDSTPDEPLAEPPQQPPLDHARIENENAPDECLFFPRGASESELIACWIVADENGFVALESMR